MKKTLVLTLAALCAFAQSAFARDVRIGFYGDSTAYGTSQDANGNYYRTRQNEPDLLQWKLQEIFGVNVFVENHGRPGSICSDFLWGQRGVTHDWATEMAASPVDLVIVNFGLNDAGVLSLGDFQFCMTKLAQIAESHGKVFAVNTPNPVDKHYNSAYGPITQVGIGLGRPAVDHWNGIMNEMPNWKSHLPDGIHPDDAMYENKANRTVQQLRPIIQQLGGF